MLFEHFPYTNFHDLNLDWIIKKIKQFGNSFKGTSAEAVTLPTGSDATATVTGGDDGQPFKFIFGLPRGVQGATGPRGVQGIQGERGLQGIPGNDGKSFEISGQVDTVAELPVNPPVGTAYYVGTTIPRYVYGFVVYNNVAQWINQGTLEGPVGPVGPSGPQGIQGVAGPKGESGELAIDSLDLTYGSSVVDYNTTDGITLNATGQVINEDAATHDFTMEIEIPIKATDGLSMDADAVNEYIEIKAVPDDETIEINTDDELSIKALPYLTVAPTANNTNGIKIVYLTSDPATKYSGYLYLIAES